MSTKTKPNPTPEGEGLPEPTSPTIPPALQATAAELAASAAEQAANLASAQASEADLSARAYRLLQEDKKAGNDIKGWSHYLEKATKN